MSASTSAPLTHSEIQAAQQKADAIANAGTRNIQEGQFVFFAAFDGTNNVKDDPAFSGDFQSTSVGQLYDQYGSERPGGYYPGPGTPGSLKGSSWNDPQVTEQMQLTVKQAYEDFREQALNWLAADPTRSPDDIRVMTMGFSRGGATAVVFTQELAARGLTRTDNHDGTITRTIVLDTGELYKQLVDAANRPFLTAQPGDNLIGGSTGFYAVLNANGEERSTYDVHTQNYTQYSESGVAITGNRATGEYEMRVPKGDGGELIYSRWAQPDGDGAYLVRQAEFDVNGRIVHEYVGQQASLSADLQTVSITQVSDGMRRSEIYSGHAPVGQALVQAPGAHATLDDMASWVTSLRELMGTHDGELALATEWRALSGSAAEGEDWGGQVLLAASDSVLGDYWRLNQTGQARGFALNLDDPGVQGLGLLNGYALDKIAARTVASALMWGAQPQTQGTPGDDVFLAGRSYYAPSTPVPGFESNGALRPRSTYGAMSGALGDDTYVVTHRSDLVIEKPNEGMDTVRASLSHRLADNVENLQLVGTTAIDGTGNALANVLVGNAADNVLSGEAGDDTLTGGRGNDVLRGGAGNDVYQFARGDGVDRIDQSDALDADWDTVTFAPGIREDQLWFRQFGVHLEVGVMGGDDRLVLDDWFTDKARAVDAFELSDGQRLLYQQVDVLVQAMAAFAPPAPGQTAWTADQRSAFAPMLAVNPL